jgi:hypothetical protein
VAGRGDEEMLAHAGAAVARRATQTRRTIEESCFAFRTRTLSSP